MCTDVIGLISPYTLLSNLWELFLVNRVALQIYPVFLS